MASPTTNKGFTYAAHGGSVNAWDTQLNADLEQLDINLGGVYLITASSTTTTSSFNTNSATVPATATSITPSASLAQNMFYRVAGAVNSTMTILFPTVGSFYVIANEMSSGTLKVNTTAGTSAVTISAGGNNMVVTSTYASQSANIVGQFAAKLYTSVGTPAITATAGSAEGDLTTAAWDTTNKQLYVCTTSGTSATAVFIPTNPRIVPEGYLTLSTDPNNPILTADAAAKTAVYYTPYVGDWTLVSNGTVTYPYQFSQLALSLTAGVQTANNIYDVYIYNSTAGVLIGTGPAWINAAAGTGARGTGAGTTQLARLGGVWTNAVQITLTNGSTSFTCPVNQGVYLGSILMDATAGQVTCHRSYGQSRKWGVWNNYNRQQLQLKAGDATASWSYASTTMRFSDGSSQNALQVFVGLQEEPTRVSYLQYTSAVDRNITTTVTMSHGIGWNSSASMSGTINVLPYRNDTTSQIRDYNGATGEYLVTAPLGMNQAYALEQLDVTSGGLTFSMRGTESYMALSAFWRG